MNFETAKLCPVKLTSIWIPRTRKMQKPNTILENNSYTMQPRTLLPKDFTASELMTPWRSKTVCAGQDNGGLDLLNNLKMLSRAFLPQTRFCQFKPSSQGMLILHNFKDETIFVFMAGRLVTEV